MAKRQRNRDFHEPWSLVKSDLWRMNFTTPPFRKPADEEQRQANADWEAAKAKAEKYADILIMGSRMAEPAMAETLGGEAVYFDDRRILTFSRTLGLPEWAPTHAEVAQRVVDCVNAMTGISDPVGFMGELVALLTDMSRDPIDDFFSGRAMRLMFRIAEHKELVEAHQHEEGDCDG